MARDAPGIMPAASPLGWAVPVYVLFMSLAAAALAVRGTPAGAELSPDRTVFAVVNAATLTGFAYEIGVDSFTAVGQAVMVGLTLAGTLMALVLGGMGVVRAVGLPYTDRQVVACSLFLLGVATFGGTAAVLTPDRDLLPAMLLGIGSLGNGGLGVAVVLDVVDRARGARRCLSPHAQAALLLTAGLYLVGAALLWAADAGGDAGAAGASALAVNSRTLGLPLDFAGRWPRVAQWVVVLLMAVGTTAGGTGGGLKVTTLAALAAGTRAALRGQATGRAFGIAVVWVSTYGAVVVLTTLLLLLAQPQVPAERVLFLAVSAAGNVGLSHDTVAITGPGLYVLSAAMLAGRLVPLWVLWWVVRTGERARFGVG